MFNLGGLNDLARGLGVELSNLHEVLDDFDVAPERLVKELTLWDPDATKRPRDVIAIRAPWRLIQERIYKKLLIPWFKPSIASHGGVKGRSPATNARVHLGNTHAFVADISNFFPSISCFRVNRLFLAHACSPEVAGALTRLCTYEFHLALGLVTSPIIANELLRIIDTHIEHACRKRNLRYTRFIDDITISGKYDLMSCDIADVVQKILKRYRFKVAKSKTDHGRLDTEDGAEEQLAITGVRLKRNHIDASRKFMQELDRILVDHLSLSQDGPFAGPLFMQDEVFGKAYYACSLNPGRRRMILGKLKEIAWWKAMGFAFDRGLLRLTKQMTPRGSVRPDCSIPLAGAAGAKFVKEFYENNPCDSNEAPFDVPCEAVSNAV